MINRMLIPKNMMPLAMLIDLYRVGDCPNKEMQTMGGKKFWDTLQVCPNGWRLQQNKITKLCRILDENDIRKAWGSRYAMEEKLKRLTRKEFLEFGDIIGIDRAGGIYEHFAVYIGNNRVIHYQGESNDFSGPITVHEASISDFLKDDKKYFVLIFDTKWKNVIKLRARTQFAEAEVLEENILKSIFIQKEFCLYTPEQTVNRAKTRLGEKEYNLISQNCEHFSVWCKTGISCSFQVKRALKWAELISALNTYKIPLL